MQRRRHRRHCPRHTAQRLNTTVCNRRPYSHQRSRLQPAPFAARYRRIRSRAGHPTQRSTQSGRRETFRRCSAGAAHSRHRANRRACCLSRRGAAVRLSARRISITKRTTALVWRRRRKLKHLLLKSTRLCLVCSAHQRRHSACSSGILPAWKNRDAAAGTIRLVREGRIIDHAQHGMDGLLTMLSVKYTAARLLAEQAIDGVSRRLNAGQPCQTRTTRSRVTECLRR